MNVPDFLNSSPWLGPALDAALRSTLLLALAAAAVRLLRRASAAARHCVWTLGLSGALLLPVLTLALPRWEMPIVTVDVREPGFTPAATVLPDRAASAARPGRGAALPRHGIGKRPLRESTSAADLPPTQGSDPAVSPVAGSLLPGIWMAGALVVLARLTAGLLAVRWMSRRMMRVTDAPWLPLARRVAADMGIGPTLTFLRSDRATMPMAWGVWRPAVLMPADADRWPADRLRIVLLHELAHVKRRDCLTHVLSQLACAVYWFNPLVWIAARHARAERERACDDLVLASGTRGSDYADQLLELARARRDGRFPMLLTGATLAMAHRTQLEGRLIAILDPGVRRARLSRAAAAGAATLAACAVLPLASVQPWAYAEPAAAEKPAQTYGYVESIREPAGQPASEALAAPGQSPRPEPAPGRGARSFDGIDASIAAAAAEATLEALGQGAVEGLLEGAVRDSIRGALAAFGAQSTAGGSSSKQRQADPRTVAALVTALKDADTEVREAAMHALVQLRDPAIFEPLITALRDSSPDIREQAAMGLAQLQDPRALEPLMAALKDESAAVREHVVFALGRLQDARTAAAIAHALEDESASVREQAAFALGQMGNGAYFEALAAALEDSSAAVREQAAFALSQLRDPRAMAALAAALADVSASVREQAVFALGQLGDPSAVDSLTKALRDAKASVREQAAFALGQIHDTRAVPALISALKDADAEVRSQAAFALGQIGDPSAVEPLVIAMKDASAEVRSQAAFALGQLGDRRAIDALTAALKDSSAEVRRQAAFALGQLCR